MTSVLAVCQKPKRRKPLIQTERAIFKDGCDLGAEFVLANVALKHRAVGKQRHALGGTAMASDAVRPAYFHHEINYIITYFITAFYSVSNSPAPAAPDTPVSTAPPARSPSPPPGP